MKHVSQPVENGGGDTDGVAIIVSLLGLDHEDTFVNSQVVFEKQCVKVFEQGVSASGTFFVGSLTILDESHQFGVDRILHLLLLPRVELQIRD